MAESIYLFRDSLIFECRMMHDVIDVRYLPRRVGVLIAFIVGAFSLNWMASLISALVVWGVLLLVLRPRIIRALRGTYIAQFAAILQFPLRWFVAIVCSVYIWYAIHPTLWDGWIALAFIFVLDFLMNFLVEAPQFAKVQQEINLLSKLPTVFTWADVELFQGNLPITTATHRPTTPEEKLASLRSVASSKVSTSNQQWLDKFTHLPPNQVWTTYSKDELANLADNPCTFVVFDNAGQTYAVGNSEWQGINGDWRRSLAKIGELKSIQINIAWLSENDDLNAACWWLEQRLSPTAILYNREKVSDFQQSLIDLEKQLGSNNESSGI